MNVEEYIEIFKQEHRMRVLNKKYWPHHIPVNNSTDTTIDINQAERWCYDNIKSSNWRNVGRYFAFKNSSDATMFALKWT